MARPPTFTTDVRGAAAAEMALSVPLLIILMFGSFELGSYFLAEHTVVGSVRDAARYAARQPYTEYPGCTPSGAVVTNTRNVARTGQPAAGGAARLYYWTDPNTITVTAACTFSVTGDDGTAQNMSGIYFGNTMGAPVVRVSAAVPYTPLIGQLGIFPATLTLNASSESAVNGA